MWLGFIAALLGFTLIGALASTRASDSVEDYLLAGRDVHPWLAGLSAVATNNSGFMFVGLLGYAYSSGLEAVSFQIAWLLGDLSSWLLAQRRVRARSGRLKLASLPRLLATRDDGEVDRAILVAGGLLTFTFLSVYAAAQLNAGSKALHVLFGWDYGVGALIGAVIVLLYCFAGGIRASIWTDAAQSMIALDIEGQRVPLFVRMADTQDVCGQIRMQSRLAHIRHQGEGFRFETRDDFDLGSTHAALGHDGAAFAVEKTP